MTYERVHVTSAGAAGLGLVVLLAGCCMPAPGGPQRGAWSAEASRVEAQRLAAIRTPDAAAPARRGATTVALDADATIAPAASPFDDDRARVPSVAAQAWAALAASGVDSGGSPLMASSGQFRLASTADEDELIAAVGGESPGASPDGSSGRPAASTEPTVRDQAERGPLPGFGQTVWRDVRRMGGELWSDTKRVYTEPTNLIILGLAGGASIALRPEVDDDIEDFYDKHHTFSADWRDAFGAMGNPGTHFAVAGAIYLVGSTLPNEKTYEVGRTLFSALIINGVSTMALKVAANTDSPNGESLAWPSGHVSSTMTFAAVMDEAYGPWAGVPLYGLTGLVAVARMDDKEHHFSDVVFGAAMGWVIGHTVASGRRPEIFGGEIVPYADPETGTAGVAWIKSLP